MAKSRIARGVIIAVLLIIVDQLLPVFYHPVPDGRRYLCRLLISFAGVLLVAMQYARKTPGAAFGDVFSYGLKTAALVAFIMVLYTFIAVKWLYPPLSAAEMDAAVKAIEQQGNSLHQEAVQQAAEAASKRWLVYASITLFAILVPGLLASAISGAAAKKSRS